MIRKVKSIACAVLLSITATVATAQEKVTYLFPAPDFLPAFAPFKIAQAKGYYKDAGLDVTFQIGKGGADVAKQVAVGNVDLGGGIGDTPIIVRANGLPVRSVAMLGTKALTQINIRKDSGVETIADLKGKSIGVLSFQDTTYYNLLAVLADAGLSKSDVDIQALGPGGIIKLMISGDIQAMSGVPEWAGAIRGAGIEVTTIPIMDIFPAFAQSILASDDTIAERPEMVAAFIEATTRAFHDVINDPEGSAVAYVAAVPQHEGKEKIMEGVMRAYIDLIYGTDLENFSKFDPERLQKVQDFYLANEIIKTAVPIEDTYTTQFVGE
ncbi:ABC transporter substrate-binding protein [Shimia sediminis]|uniref:ABC transporter substrate-binding protein n=1 Tax=Shimia sediminis TaxID=2497945 RepID=UPI000F8C449B|nr:ABC transporter substrate-binding protein [Shimia sediminis]